MRETRRGPGWDVLVVALLAIALIQISGLAEAASLPTRVQDVARHPLLGGLLSTRALAAFGDVNPRPGDPIGLLFNALALGAVILYALADMALHGRWQVRTKWLLLGVIIAACVYLPATKLMLLRAQSGPASYTHDGGVIQTEATIRYLLEGRNPYTEDYTQTPMAEWGFSAYRTALYHYPYLPWTFLLSAPFYLAGQALGGYDQRIVYLLLMAVALALAPRLVAGARRKMALVALLALNPIMGLDLIFGQNDAFVLVWMLFALVAWKQWRSAQARGQNGRGAWLAACLLYGLACASKPTAWFFAPFFALLMVADMAPAATWRTLGARLWQGAAAALARAAGLRGYSAAMGAVGRGFALRRRLALEQRSGRNGLSDLGAGGKQLCAGCGGCGEPLCAVALLAAGVAAGGAAADLVHAAAGAREHVERGQLALWPLPASLLLRQPLPQRELPWLHPRLPRPRRAERRGRGIQN